MFNKSLSRRFLHVFYRKYSTNSKPAVVPEGFVIKDIDNQVYKPRHHPGILKLRTVTVPEAALKAILSVTEDFPVKAIQQEAELLNRHLKSKKPPIERDEAKTMLRESREKVESLTNFTAKSEQDVARYNQMVKSRTENILQRHVYNWQRTDYDAYSCLVYLLARFAPEYAVLMKIFAEIAERDPSFQPRSLFDFGSGVGSVSWAARVYWKKNIFEYFNVDSSNEMNDLALLLLQGGKGTMTPLKGVFYRQFLPATKTSYDLVVSAYTLLELPSQQSRLDTILNLWNKTSKYLVVVEQGSNAGFKLINEVRDFILHARNDSQNIGHVFSPCPHDTVCPRIMSNDETPCNFQMHYFTVPVGCVSERKATRYSYVVFRKGQRDPADPQWPRVVREALVRSRHTVCRMCTKAGKLEEIIFTASKHGKTMYHCARSTRWGDRLPIKLEETDKI